jgi:hypothetical protein
LGPRGNLLLDVTLRGRRSAVGQMRCRAGQGTSCPLGGSGAILQTGYACWKGKAAAQLCSPLHTDLHGLGRASAPGDARPGDPPSSFMNPRGDKELHCSTAAAPFIALRPMTWSLDDAAGILGSPLGKLRCRRRTGTGTRSACIRRQTTDAQRGRCATVRGTVPRRGEAQKVVVVRIEFTAYRTSKIAGLRTQKVGLTVGGDINAS